MLSASYKEKVNKYFLARDYLTFVEITNLSNYVCNMLPKVPKETLSLDLLMYIYINIYMYTTAIRASTILMLYFLKPRISKK